MDTGGFNNVNHTAFNSKLIIIYCIFNLPGCLLFIFGWHNQTG